jgi:hypothetical protein
MQDLARRAPLLLILDDLQWADRGSTDLLLHLIPRPSCFLDTRYPMLGRLLVALRTAREPCAQRHQKNPQSHASSAYHHMPMLREGSDHPALLRLFGQLLEVEGVCLVVLIRVIHSNALGSPA